MAGWGVIVCLVMMGLSIVNGLGQRQRYPRYRKRRTTTPAPIYEYYDDYDYFDYEYRNAPIDYDNQIRRQGGGGGSSSSLVPLVFLAPLFGVAALYAAAYINSNPALITLATISGRKRRAVEDWVLGTWQDQDGVWQNKPRAVEDWDLGTYQDEEGVWQNKYQGDTDKEKEKIFMQEMGTVTKYISEIQGTNLTDQRDLVMSSLLHCSLLGNNCLDLLVCEFSREDSSPYVGVEREAITVVLYQIMASARVQENVKERVRVAAMAGKMGQCQQFTCSVDT